MSRPSPYAAHAAYVALARPATGPGLILVGLLAFEATFYGTPWLLVLAGAPPEMLEAMYLGATPVALALLLATFALPALALAHVVRRVHRRPARSLLGPPRLALRQFVKTGRLLLVLMLVLTVPTSGIDPDEVSRTRPVPLWLAILPLAIVATLIQTGAEELFFRGYLQQQLGALSANPLIWMVLPSAAFGLGHAWNAVTLIDALYYVGWTFLFGCIAADITARAGSLGPALALHLVNNVFQLVFFGFDGAPMSGFALVLFHWDGGPVTYLAEGQPLYNALYALLTVMMLLVLWLTARLAIRR
ncbi:MAG: CAAX amino terminal protease family [Rhodobacteraceae bacterium HLUCCA08]|nr:MAG: CAAX amino terminal protease family [Rhodobacteraceae bacterium HLUCCA08]